MTIPIQSHRNANSNQPAALRSNLDKRLLAYIAAASAAGVSALSLAPRAEAKVVVTKTNETINWGTTTLDLDNDGKPDFKFTWTGTAGFSFKSISGYKSNHIVATSGPDQCAAPLAAGVTVGRGANFKATKAIMIFTDVLASPSHSGPWANVRNRFLGLEFRLSDGVHFGWARLTVTTNPILKATLTAYAYETIPEKSIVTGRLGDDDAQGGPQISPAQGSSSTERPTLGVLAAGAPALALWRKEEAAH
jgi:hypothetical protein